MSKQDRKQKAITKQKRRLKRFGYGLSGAIHSKLAQRLKTMSTPRSCHICSPGKRLQNGLVKRTQKELQEARVEAYQYLIP